jgi:hypothetical protein
MAVGCGGEQPSSSYFCKQAPAIEGSIGQDLFMDELCVAHCALIVISACISAHESSS